MAFRVFLSHSLDPTEQALAWRLQTLAAAHGIELFVPQRGSLLPSAPKTALSTVQNAIDRSDCVLAIITAEANGSVQRELKYALAKRKLVIPIVHSDVANHPLVAQFPRVFTFSPHENPGKLEGEVVEFLEAQHLSKEKRQAAGALVLAGLALLMLFALAEK
jgi:nucleoside 2-deoxyribosyltransferase